MAEQLVDKKKIAAHLGVTPRTVTRWMYRAENPMPFVPGPWQGAPPRFRVSECERWYAGLTTAPVATETAMQPPCSPGDASCHNVTTSPHTSRGMSKWTRSITPEQEQAVYAAVLEQGMSASRACREAAAGNLPGVGPFTISPSTAARYVRAAKERRTRDRQLEPEQWEQTHAALEQEIRGWLVDGMAEIREGRDPRVNLDSARAAMRLLKELRTHGHTRPLRIPAGEAEQEQPTPPEPQADTPTLAQRILERAQQHAEPQPATPQDAASSARAALALSHARTREGEPAPC